jgi:biofilm PGA synthesis N-glycosyltransferase PgaC
MAAHIITLSVLAVYVLFTVIWLLGRWIIKGKKRKKDHSEPISVVIPYRNEQKRIKPILERLSKKILLPEGSEWIFVNDHSEDETEKLLISYQTIFPRFRLLRLSETEKGKKAALSLGIASASNSFIVTLDADTLPTQEGIDVMSGFAADREIRMVCGMVMQKSAGWAGAPFADLEFLSLSASGSAFAGLGFPFLCNGAFLGFQKEAFHKVGGYSGNWKYPGGDDLFLLEKIRKTYGKNAIRYVTHSAATAETPGDRSVTEFFQRRIRWGSKSVGYGLPGKILTVLMVWIHVSWFCLFGYHLIFGNLAHVWVVAGVKMAADLAMLGSLCIRYRRLELMPFIMPSSLLHPLYLVLGFLGSLMGTFTWKGRKYGNRPDLG